MINVRTIALTRFCRCGKGVDSYILIDVLHNLYYQTQLVQLRDVCSLAGRLISGVASLCILQRKMFASVGPRRTL